MVGIEDDFTSKLRSPGYIFHHIPKTAGSTFNLYLRLAFPNDALIVNGNFDESPHSNPEQQAKLFKNPVFARSFRIIAGHEAIHLSPLLPNYKRLTLIRDPIERAISWYYHVRYHENQDPEERRQAEALSAPEWFKMATNDFENRGYRWSFKDKTFTQRGEPEGESDEAILEKIRSRFDYVGCSEDFSDFIFFLHIKEGFPLALVSRQLVRPERASMNISEEERRGLEEILAFGRRVYDLARENFQSELEAMLTPELSALRERYHAAVAAYEAGEGKDGESGKIIIDEDGTFKLPRIRAFSFPETHNLASYKIEKSSNL